MDFGFTLKPEHTIERTVALAQQAEAAGFGYGWLFDSHILWKDVYPLLTLMAVNTEHMRLGTCVTNPATRDITVTASVLATLDEISGGRMDLGIGRGDSAQRVLGKGPVRTEVLEDAVRVIRDLAEGRKATYRDTELDLPWAKGRPLPVWIAGYGPKVLGLAGRVADGVILQLADRELLAWMIGIMHEAAGEAGEVRDHRAHPGLGTRARPEGCARQRGVPRHRRYAAARHRWWSDGRVHQAERCHARRGPTQAATAHPAPPLRHTGGHRGHGVLPRFPGGVVHHG
jgi:alkanesulfonate monooxygenase SsuD/methylene tetrahydromethanopterin reductase-like flavin-dependent oxidoreductase (luciferase family)